LPTGDIYMMRTEQTGDFVRAGRFDFYDQNDPSLQARGIDAPKSLMGEAWCATRASSSTSSPEPASSERESTQRS